MTRCRLETATIGPAGAVLSSTVDAQVQAVFPEGALMKSIKVGLQVRQQPEKQQQQYDFRFIFSFIFSPLFLVLLSIDDLYAG